MKSISLTGLKSNKTYLFSDIVPQVVVLTFIVIGIALVVFTSKNYLLGVTPDSVTYLEVADNFANGKGVTDHNQQVINHWPPLYPITLGLVTKYYTHNLFSAGILLNAIALGLMIFVFNIILLNNPAKIVHLIIINVILIISYPVTIYSMFWSEGLFMMMILTALMLLLNTRPSHYKTLIASGIIFGLSIITRYAGIGICGGVLIYLLFFESVTLKRRIQNTIVFSGATLIPVVIWLVYAIPRGFSSADREFFFHPITWDQITSFFGTLNQWVNPLNKYLGVVILGGILAYMVYRYKSEESIRNNIHNTVKLHKHHLFLLSLAVACYLVFLVLAFTFMDAQVSFGNRMLAPIFPVLLLIIFPFFNSSVRLTTRPINMVIIAVILISMSIGSYGYWRDHIVNGNGYTSRYWHNSSLLQAALSIQDVKIYSNGPDVLTVYGSVNATIMPRLVNPFTSEKNHDFDNQFANMVVEVNDSSAVIVYLDSVGRKTMPEKSFILSNFDSSRYMLFEDGFIIGKLVIEKH